MTSDMMKMMAAQIHDLRPDLDTKTIIKAIQYLGETTPQSMTDYLYDAYYRACRGEKMVWEKL